VFERFTERARQVVVLAQEEARALKHNYIGTEHLLLGLLREEEGLAARVLSTLDVTIEYVRESVRSIVGEGGEAQTGQIPFTPRAKKTLELALREGLRLGHNYIGTEHILLGLARLDDGVAAEILRDRGVVSERIEEVMMGMLGGTGTAMPPAPRGRLHLKRGARLFDLVVVGWVLFGVSLGFGILIGWAIWGH
jgi:ATP-dependent Clp protease ATP-binding subunit ClpC